MIIYHPFFTSRFELMRAISSTALHQAGESQDLNNRTVFQNRVRHGELPFWPKSEIRSFITKTDLYISFFCEFRKVETTVLGGIWRRRGKQRSAFRRHSERRRKGRGGQRHIHRFRGFATRHEFREQRGQPEPFDG